MSTTTLLQRDVINCKFDGVGQQQSASHLKGSYLLQFSMFPSRKISKQRELVTIFNFLADSGSSIIQNLDLLKIPARIKLIKM